jgi:hypothetical protein
MKEHLLMRTMRIALLIVTVVGLQPSIASASAWGWLEQFSGPGPFEGDPFHVTVCPVNIVKDDGSRQYVGLFGDKGNRAARRSCYFVDVGPNFKTDAARPFPAIKIQTYDFGGSFRFWDSIDVGAGFGFFHIDPERRDSSNHFTVTPFRLVMHPGVLAFDDVVKTGWKRELLGAAAVYFKGTFVMGTLTGETFGANASAFHVNADFVRSAGFVIDGWALARGLDGLVRAAR